MGERGERAGKGNGRNYVVVSADTHASPDSLDHFLSYVDPASREQVAAFGDMSPGDGRVAGDPRVCKRAATRSFPAPGSGG